MHTGYPYVQYGQHMQNTFPPEVYHVYYIQPQAARQPSAVTLPTQPQSYHVVTPTPGTGGVGTIKARRNRRWHSQKQNGALHSAHVPLQHNERVCGYGGMAPYGTATGAAVSSAIELPQHFGNNLPNKLSQTNLASVADPATGMIFGCTNETIDECFSRSLVGMPLKYAPLAQSIVPDHTLLFLFNFSTRTLHGVLLATSASKENINSHAFSSKGEPSPFPVQCTFKVIEATEPVAEQDCRQVLEYTKRNRFRFKLSKWQCHDLLSIMGGSQIAHDQLG